MSKEKKKEKVIPFERAIAMFVIWTILLSVGGYCLYSYVLKPYIIDKPTVIQGGIPTK